MSDVTRILSAVEHGDPKAAEQLLPLVYDELRKLAAAKLMQEKPGNTLQATALVHEAYLRLVGGEEKQGWNSRGHFFAAAGGLTIPAGQTSGAIPVLVNGSRLVEPNYQNFFFNLSNGSQGMGNIVDD